MPLRAENEPIFKVRVDASACRFELRVNDVVVHNQAQALPLDAEFPVNEWLHDGENHVSVRVQPPPVTDEEGFELYEDEEFDLVESRLTATLFVKPNGAPRETRRTIATLMFLPGGPVSEAKASAACTLPGWYDSTQGFLRVDDIEEDGEEKVDHDGDVKLSPLVHQKNAELKLHWVSRTVTMPLAFPRWGWLGGEELEHDEDTEAALIAEYRKFWDLLAARDVQAVGGLLANKVDEYATAYYVKDPQERADLAIAPDLMQSDDLTLQPLADADDVELEVFGNGRLARLVDLHENPIILFANKDDVGYYFGLIYSRIDGRWVICR